MSICFNFGFLGPEHNYVASVTQVSSSGYPIEPSDTACFRLPASWTEAYEYRASSQYIFNIRGHDFLCHAGRWKNIKHGGSLKAAKNMMLELKALQIFGQIPERENYDRTEIKLTLGPDPGSFFADAEKLSRYDWGGNLPEELGRILRFGRPKLYGDIANLAINAAGGWVIHFHEQPYLLRVLKGCKKTVRFRWGGDLPDELVEALEWGFNRGATIVHIFLNHQHRFEFVLLFSDGHAHVNLHTDFEKSIRRLLEVWATKRLRNTLKWHFSFNACWCAEEQQERADAAYYNRRGRFHLTRGNCDLALSYLREAVLQDRGNDEIQGNLRLALVATRRSNRDEVLERNLQQVENLQIDPGTFLNDDHTSAGVFRNQYMRLIGQQDVGELERQLIQLTANATDSRAPGLSGEWSYSLGSEGNSRSPIEIALPVERVVVAGVPPHTHELEGYTIEAAAGGSESGLQPFRRVSEMSSEAATSPRKAEVNEEKSHYWFYR